MTRIGRFTAAAIVASLWVLSLSAAAQTHSTFTDGDVFIAVGNGQIQWRLPDGTLNKTLVSGVAGNTFTTGMAFDSSSKLYATMFGSDTVSVFANDGSFLTTFGSGYNSLPESILFDAAGNAYVGQAGGTFDVLKFSSTGTLLSNFNVAVENRGSDWIDLASDQCTLLYTSEGTRVKRFNVCNGLQLTDFNAAPLPGTAAFALRILSDGGVLVADSQTIVRLDANGNIVQQYDAAGQDGWFALNLDPDGTSFWSADFNTSEIFRFDIATGTVVTNFSSGTGPGTVFGITVKGEITAAQKTPPARVCLPTTQPPQHFECVTRNALFWFTHAETNDPTCVTLKRAIEANGGELCVGFQTLPVEYENNDNVKDAEDALIEALGFYWKNHNLTGEDNGTQTMKLRASALCTARKYLGVQLIAAIGNNVLLGTSPTNCTYFNGGTITNFPADLIDQAGVAAKGEKVADIVKMTRLLKKFNRSGLTNDFQNGLVECNAWGASRLKRMSRDPMTQITCPGINDTLETAQSIVSLPFSTSVDLRNYHDDLSNPGCGVGGVEAIWKISPPVAAAHRNFIVDTNGSNIETLLSVWQSVGTTAVPVFCSDNPLNVVNAPIIFTADGASTFYIVGEGANGTVGTLKIRVRSF